MKATSVTAILLAARLFFPSSSFAQTKSKEAAAYASSGIAKLKRHDFDGAILDFNRALQFDPKLAKVYVDRGVAKQGKRDLDGAIADFNRALQFDPRLADAHYNRGLAKTHRHQLIAYGGVDISRRNYEANPKLNRSDLDGAIADYSRALQLDPKNANAYHGRGIAKSELGDFDGAIADFNRALQLDPQNAKTYNTLGNAKSRKGDLEGAIADYNHSLQLDPKNAKAFHNRGIAKIDSGDAVGAITDFNRTLQLDLKDTFTYEGRGSANFLARNWTAALADYRRSFELSRSNQYPHIGIWMIRSRLGEREAANKEFATHFSAEPGSWLSKVKRYLLGDLSESEFLAAVSPDLKISPGQRCKGWFYAGMKNLLDGNKTAAAEFFKKCVATGQRSVVEHAFAKAELKALGQ
ncbi:MAG: tetratricopeptide repeat protein [Candidatus Udaeobacter sp.]